MLNIFNLKTSGVKPRKALILFWIQIALLLLLFATAIIVLIVDRGERRVLYLMLIISLMGFIAVALKLNLSGKYIVSAWITTIFVSIGPWVSILADKTVMHSDFLPIIYLVLSIQICSILLSERITLVIAVTQLCSIVAYVFLSPNRMDINWPSLFAFMVFASTIAIVSSSVNRKLMKQIEESQSKLQNDKIQLHELSVRDSLTGLFNRRYMEETLKREISRSIRKNQGLGLIITDVDNFKIVNDSYGHVFGDSILCQIANVLNKNIRKSDVACRYGGDEFILILPDCSLNDIIKKADILRLEIEKEIFKYEEEELGFITLSFGVAAIPDNGTCAEDLIKAADKALYVAKKEGRNCVRSTISDAAAHLNQLKCP